MVREVLMLRGDLAKSSVKKYQAMRNVAGADERGRGLIQFYGAERTGRFAGRLVQVQNLPRNYLPDLTHTRTLLRSGNHEALELLYGSVPSTRYPNLSAPRLSPHLDTGLWLLISVRLKRG